MHPAFHSWWQHARNAGWSMGDNRSQPGFCGPGGRGGGGYGPGGRGGPGHGGPGHGGDGHGGHGHGPPGGPRGPFGGGPDDVGGFGVRRPLRFLAHKLELSEAQVPELARILDELKTERAQAEVDNRRTVTAFADALEGGTFGDARAREGGELRVKSAERLRDAVTLALSRIHALLDDDQRKRLSYLVRTGVITL